jgi:hypothetical protein
MFCFAFEYHLQYELSNSPLFVISIAHIADGIQKQSKTFYQLYN